eukprot:7391818-Pyramimonas_sp.AAC.1
MSAPASEACPQRASAQSLPCGKKSAVGQPRVLVRAVPLAHDMTAAPPKPSDPLERASSTAQRAELAIRGAPAL